VVALSYAGPAGACVQLDRARLSPNCRPVGVGYGAVRSAMGKLPVRLRRLVWKPLDRRWLTVSSCLSRLTGLGRLFLAALPGARPDTYLLEERAVAWCPCRSDCRRCWPPHRRATAITRYCWSAMSRSGCAGRERTGSVAGGDDARQSHRLAAAAGTKEEVKKIQTSSRAGFQASAPPCSKKRPRPNPPCRRRDAPVLALATHGFFAHPKTPDFGRNSGPDAYWRPATRPAVPPSMLAGIVLAGANRPLNVDEDDGISDRL